jgi:hypothetical protein
MDLEKAGVIVNHLDAQAFSPTLPHEEGFEFTALYTLQHRLPRNPEFDGGFEHRQVFRWGLLDNPGAQLIGDANLPWRAGSDLLARDKAICQPAVNRRSVQAKNLCRLTNRRQFSWRWFSRRLEAGDVAIAAQAPDLVGREAFAGRGFALLAIEDAGDDFIRIKRGQAAQQRDGIFVGPRTPWAGSAGREHPRQ